MPHRLPEVRYSKRVLVGLFIAFVVGLCLATTISIVRSLQAQGGTEAPAKAGPPRAPNATALTELQTLFQELRGRGETIGRTALDRTIRVDKWEAWSVAWRARFDRLGQRYGLDAKGDRTGPFNVLLQRAYRGTLELLGAYDLAVRNLAAARRAAVESVKKTLEEATQALGAARAK